VHTRTDVPHRHLGFKLNPDMSLGYLHCFRVDHDKDSGVFTYDFTGVKSHHPDSAVADELQELIDEGKKSGRLWAVYYPAWLFGPRVLPPGPCNILKALTHELTRVRGRRADRPDKAEVIPGSTHPILTPGQKYVQFNGNGPGKRARFHGRGYTLKTWMERAGYLADADDPSFWKEARRFLKDLQSLGEPFGLVVGGYRLDKREWQSLERLIVLTRSAGGRKWVKGCRLKVFAPEDYLVRWRRHLARALGFSFIPGGPEQEPATSPAPAAPVPVIASAQELDAWMRQQGLTDQMLAERLGVSRALVSYYRSGSRPWSISFQEKLAAHLEGRES
jgi:hypothetical protein